MVTETENQNKEALVTKGDFILFKIPYSDNSGYAIQLGKVINITEIDEGRRLVLQNYTEELETDGEESLVLEENIICNLFKAPTAGHVYGKFIKEPPVRTSFGEHSIFIYFPKEVTDRSVEPFLKSLEDTFTKIENLRASFCNKSYEIHIKEGDVQKSSIKKSKKDFDNCLNLNIRFVAPDTVSNALINVFSQALWKAGTKENKADWLRVFSSELVFEKLNNQAFTSKFLEFLSEDKAKDTLETEDEIVCKLIVKEIKKVKCLSLKELKILAEVNGDTYIESSILPEVINSVRLKNSVRINPLQGMTARKKFSSELSSFVFSQKIEAEYETPLRLFFD